MHGCGSAFDFNAAAPVTDEELASFYEKTPETIEAERSREAEAKAEAARRAEALAHRERSRHKTLAGPSSSSIGGAVSYAYSGAASAVDRLWSSVTPGPAVGRARMD